MVHTFVHGVANGISGIASVAFGVSFTVFSLFFLLKDGPKLHAWTDRHLGVPAPAAATITGGVIHGDAPLLPRRDDRRRLQRRRSSASAHWSSTSRSPGRSRSSPS